jgi:hypothetical protein
MQRPEFPCRFYNYHGRRRVIDRVTLASDKPH